MMVVVSVPPATIIRRVPTPAPTAVPRSVPSPGRTVPWVVPTVIPAIIGAIPSPVPRVIPIVGIAPGAPERIVISRVYDRDVGIGVDIDITVRAGRTHIVVVVVEHHYLTRIATLGSRDGLVGRTIVLLFGGGSVEFSQHGFVFGFSRQSLLLLQFGFGGFTLGELGFIVNAIKIAGRRNIARRTSGEHGGCHSQERDYPKTL
jgi:hypothetical protein